MSIVLKQVYQNRLIEGVDFERWDWLSGNGIIRLPYYNSDYEIVFKTYLQTNINISDGNICNIILYLDNSTNPFFHKKIISDIGNVGSMVERYLTSTIQEGVIIRLVASNNSITIDGYATTYYSKTQQYGDSTNLNGGCYNSVVVADRLSLTPCKLIQPCPANLSSTGKAYPAGKCGMIDSVSGLFYTSDVGEFSVYNNEPAEAEPTA